MWPFSRKKAPEPVPPPEAVPPAPAPETELERIQREFFERIVDGKPGLAGIDDWRLQIYAGMYEARTHDALIEDVPHTAKLLGAEFAPVVKRYVAELPSRHYSLARLGHGFAKWLREKRGAPSPLSYYLGESSRGAQTLSRLQAPRDSADATILRGSSSALLGLRAKPALGGERAGVRGDSAEAALPAAPAGELSAAPASTLPGEPPAREPPPSLPESGSTSVSSAEAPHPVPLPSGGEGALDGHDHHHHAPLSSEHATRPDLADLAELEWARSESFIADDCSSVEPEAVQQLGPERFTRCWLQFVPSLRLLELKHDVLALWKACEDGAELPAPAEKTTHAIVWRKGFEVFHVAIAEDEYQAMKAAQAREPVAQICERFAARGDDAAHAAFQAIGSWLTEGMIAALREPPSPDTFGL